MLSDWNRSIINQFVGNTSPFFFSGSHTAFPDIWVSDYALSWRHLKLFLDTGICVKQRMGR